MDKKDTSSIKRGLRLVIEARIPRDFIEDGSKIKLKYCLDKMFI